MVKLSPRARYLMLGGPESPPLASNAHSSATKTANPVDCCSEVLMRISQILMLSALLHAGVAEARFGKGGGGSSGSGGPQPTHAAVPVDSRGSSSSSSSSSSATSSSSTFSSSVFDPTRRLGYFSGAFVPMYGYGA